MRLLIVVVFLVLYAYVTIHISRIQQQDCLSVQEVAVHMRRLEKLEQEISPNNESQSVLKFLQGNPRITAPRGAIVLAPLGVEMAIGLPYQPPAKKNVVATTPSLFVHDAMPVHSLLNNSYSPNTVYYMWCGRRWFEFTHYLSVLSVIHHLRPDNIVLYYDTPPIVDSWTYNTWFGELTEKYAFLRSQQLASNEPGCSGYAQPNMQFIYDLLTIHGGMYINEMTIISQFPLGYRLYDIVYAMDVKKGTGLMMTKRGFPGKEGPLKNTRARTKTFECVDVAQFVDDARHTTSCLFQTGSLYPKDIWNLDNSFGRLVRNLFYGSPEVKKTVPSYDELVPNIAHIVWLGGGAMDFLFYLCVLSLVHVAKVQFSMILFCKQLMS